MRRTSLVAKLLLLASLVTACIGLAVERMSARQIEAVVVERSRAELAAKARLVEDLVRLEAEGTRAARPAGVVAWDAIADRCGERAGARVTILAPDGSVLGDSEVPRAEVAGLENHGARDEVAQARASGEGTVVRPSPTLRVPMMYFALRYAQPDDGVGFLRVAVPMRDLDAAMGHARALVAAGTALAVLVAIAIAVGSTFVLARPLRRLTEVALSMSAGDLSARAPEGESRETAALARALNRVAGELSRTIGELREERDLLAGILDAMSEGVLVADGAGRIALANRAFRSIARVSADVVGKTPLETLRSAALEDVLAAVARGGEHAAREIELGGAAARRLLVTASRLGATPGQGVVAVFHDVTELRRLETIRTDFVANVSHELRTPVTAIATAAETLRSGALDRREAAREFVDVIERQSLRLRQLVDDLLDLARIESKGFRLRLEPVDVRAALVHVVRLLEEPARRRRVDVSVSVGPEVPAALAERRALEQVLANLLDNALKYAGAGARVVLSAVRAGDAHVEIAVSDDGPGIPPQHIGRIFERFYRVDPGRSRELGGTGLGLSIVKHLVERMRGSIEVESKPGAGARFVVRLPRAPAKSDP